MRIPSQRDCYRMMAAIGMLPHIAAHSIQVCRVSTWLCDAMAGAGGGPDRDLVLAGALLHDITKTRSFDTGENHARTGEVYLVDRGYPEVGRIVAQHVKLDRFEAAGPVGAAEVVNYADKRVLHDRIVSMPRRMAYILERYGGRPEHRERIRALWRETERLEAKLFRGLAAGPDDVAPELGAEGLAAALKEYAACGRDSVS